LNGFLYKEVTIDSKEKDREIVLQNDDSLKKLPFFRLGFILYDSMKDREKAKKREVCRLLIVKILK